jgi:hypothetical protein
MATDIEKVRVLIPDTEAVFNNGTETLFSDTEIDTYLAVAGGNVLRAAGFAIMAIATSEALISKVIKTQDLGTDGAKVAEAMRKNAEVLFARADAELLAADAFYINILDPGISYPPELTEWNWSYQL